MRRYLLPALAALAAALSSFSGPVDAPSANPCRHGECDSLFVDRYDLHDVKWEEKGISFHLDDLRPGKESVEILVRTDVGDTPATVFLRHPEGASEMRVKINHVQKALSSHPGDYIVLDRLWHDHDYLLVELCPTPM